MNLILASFQTDKVEILICGSSLKMIQGKTISNKSDKRSAVLALFAIYGFSTISITTGHTCRLCIDHPTYNNPLVGTSSSHSKHRVCVSCGIHEIPAIAK